MAQHKIVIASTPRGYGRYTHSYECSCGARGWESPTRHRAREAGKEHQRKAASR